MPHVHKELTGRARAIRVLVAVLELVAFGLLDVDLRPIGFEFVGDDDRPAGPHALPHLGAVAGDGDGTIFGDRHENLRAVLPAVRHPVGAEAGRLRHARQRDRKNQGTGPAEKAAAAQIDDGADAGGIGGRVGKRTIVRHHSAPLSELVVMPAACLMAARMRG